MNEDVLLRDVAGEDLSIFFEQQRDPVACRMAAFTAENPGDEAAFRAKWGKILGDGTVAKKTVVVGGRVAGNVLSFVAAWSGRREVSYWIGREFWGRGVATRAVAEFVRSLEARPLSARAAKDNVGSIRVLEKCGFVVTGFGRGFANARGEEIEEVVLELKAEATAVLGRVDELSEAEREEVRVLAVAVYPPEQFADWPGRHLEWSGPEWCVRVRDERGALVSYLGVFVREAEWDGGGVRVGGIGGVKTHPAAQGRGFAAQGIARAFEFFREEAGAEFALLVCEPRLMAYYARLGWREFGGRLLVRQHGEMCEFTFNRVMTCGVRGEGPVSGVIDLRGPAW